jgi:hypothetical protein
MSNTSAVTSVFGCEIVPGIPWYLMFLNETHPIHGMSAGDATEAIVG